MIDSDNKSIESQLFRSGTCYSARLIGRTFAKKQHTLGIHLSTNADKKFVSRLGEIEMIVAARLAARHRLVRRVLFKGDCE